jgi:hypothetical protein
LDSAKIYFRNEYKNNECRVPNKSDRKATTIQREKEVAREYRDYKFFEEMRIKPLIKAYR